MTHSAELDTLARTGRLDDRRLVPYLDGLGWSDLVGLLGQPETMTDVAVSRYPTWHQGDPRPGLADEDPAVMCAIGRCAMARWRSNATFGRYVTQAHPEPCGWCEYPMAELIRALDWSTWHSQNITAEAMVWRRSDGSSYRRPTGREGSYGNPRWAAFARLSEDERRYRVDRAMADSRAMLDPIPASGGPEAPQPASPAVLGAVAEAHAPWCDLRPDHDGDCPNPPEEDA